MLDKKYRPKGFAEVVGHKEVKESLKSLFFNKGNEIPHAFLFSGPSGTGKTTLARIICNLLKAGESDIYEVNIANTNGVDFIRNINEASKFSPLMGDSKLYILDEVQQLTKEGQNCILKLLEDPPKYSYFVLCTTDPTKLLKPLRDRCISYTLDLLKNKEIEILLKAVIDEEGLNISEDILNLLIYKAEGCPRKSLMMLDQVKDISDFDTACKLLADELDKENEIVDLCRLIIKRPKPQWKDVVKVYEATKVEPEQMRVVVAGYLAGCMKKSEPSFYADKLQLFLSPLTFGSQKSEMLYLIYRAWSS